MKAIQNMGVLGLVALMAAAPPAQAQQGLSALSEASVLPVALSVAGPVALLGVGATLSVVVVEASAQGTMIVLERASDGARASVQLAGQASLAVGAVVTVSAIGTGWLLSSAGKVVALVPNAVGQALMHHEQVTR